MKLSDEVGIKRIADLKDHPENSKYNSDLTFREEASLKASIAEVGIQEALLIKKDGTILSGHQRKRIAASLGLKEVPCREVDCTYQEEIYLLVAANEARRGEEKDLMKKAMHVRILYEHWGIKPGRKSAHDAHFSRHDVAQSLNLDDSSIRRLLKLLYLIPELQIEVSKQRIGLIAGNRIASLNREDQKLFYEQYKLAGHLSTAAISKLVEQISESGKDLSYKSLQKEKKRKLLAEKVERVKRDLVWLMTEDLDEEGRNELQVILITYASRFKGDLGGEIDH